MGMCQRRDSPDSEILVESSSGEKGKLDFISPMHQQLTDLVATESLFESHTPGLVPHTTVAGKCPSSPEDEQEKQGESRDRQGALEALEKVVEAPGDDGVVIKSHVERDHSAGDTDAPHVGAHVVPSPDGSFAQALTYGQLHVEARYAFKGQHDEIGNEKGSYVGRVDGGERISPTIREPPHVAKSHGISNGGQHELQLRVPRFTSVVALRSEFGLVVGGHHVNGHSARSYRAHVTHIEGDVSGPVPRVGVPIVPDEAALHLTKLHLLTHGQLAPGVLLPHDVLHGGWVVRGCVLRIRGLHLSEVDG
ncbi:hypothetical protein TNCV_683051 [Trichonephila clavipes]|nr:hypothetical protein TNCV_683051 [Trichonephila clavipes]